MTDQERTEAIRKMFVLGLFYSKLFKVLCKKL